MAALQGHAYAMELLGAIHYEEQEYDQAMGWFTKGAEAGLPKAMFGLGGCLDKGLGLAAPDYPEAAGWYHRAAEGGDALAAWNLCTMYTVGRGVTRSKRRAMQGCARPPTLATPTRARISPVICTLTFPTPVRPDSWGRPPGPSRRPGPWRGTASPRMS